MKRELDIAIISDVHLGTYGCHAKELLNYLNSIKPKNTHFKRRFYRYLAI